VVIVQHTLCECPCDEANRQIGNTEDAATGTMPELENFVGFQVVNDYLEYWNRGEGDPPDKLPTIDWKGFYASNAAELAHNPVPAPKLIRKIAFAPPLYIDEPAIPLSDLETHVVRVDPEDIAFPYSALEFLKCVWLNYTTRSAFVTIEGVDYPVTFQTPGSGATSPTITFAVGVAGRSATAQVVKNGSPVLGNCEVMTGCCDGWYCVDGVVSEVLSGGSVPTGTIVLGPYSTEAEAIAVCDPCPECTCEGVEKLKVGVNTFTAVPVTYHDGIHAGEYLMAWSLYWLFCPPKGNCSYTVTVTAVTITHAGTCINPSFFGPPSLLLRATEADSGCAAGTVLDSDTQDGSCPISYPTATIEIPAAETDCVKKRIELSFNVYSDTDDAAAVAGFIITIAEGTCT
jgi:hypothetical protein